MAFCEDCGAPLSPGVAFCENCGAKINQALYKTENNIIETGIVYTNLNLLSSIINQSANLIVEIIDGFITDAAERGIGYELLDVSSQVSGIGTVQNHIDIIRTQAEKKHFKYLFILGSYDVIPTITWENEAADKNSDTDVTSDLPYATLDTVSPFNGQNYDFDDVLRVGRLPNVDFANYFKNLKESCGKMGDIHSFGLSAAVWENLTEYIYKKYCPDGSYLYSSPHITKENLQRFMPSKSNLLLFNLHGSDKTEFWYGQEDSSYPEAMDHSSLEWIDKPYFLAVEACYGAYYEGRTKENSILLSALNGKCLSFLGSSRIAFGTPEPLGTCADIICGEFIRLVQSGESAGDAFNKARKQLTENEQDSSSIKTLAEFALYGDPSVQMNGSPKVTKGILYKNENKSFTKGIRIPLPDVRRAVKLELIEVEQKINDLIEDFVYSKHSDMRGIKANYYKSTNSISADIEAIFKKDNEIGKKIVSVRFTQNGKIKKIIESK